MESVVLVGGTSRMRHALEDKMGSVSWIQGLAEFVNSVLQVEAGRRISDARDLLRRVADVQWPTEVKAVVMAMSFSLVNTSTEPGQYTPWTYAGLLLLTALASIMAPARILVLAEEDLTEERRYLLESWLQAQYPKLDLHVVKLSQEEGWTLRGP